MSLMSTSEPSLFQLLTHKKKTVRMSPSRKPSEERFDLQYRAYADTDTLSIFFKKATPGVIIHTEDIAPGILAGYSASEQLISLDLHQSSIRTPCHFYDTTNFVNGKQPLALSWDFNSDKDQLTIFLTSGQYIGREEKTEDPNIFMCTDAGGLWQAIIIRSAKEFVSQ